MKYLILLVIIVSVFTLFRIFKKNSKDYEFDKKEDKIVDLEKDPNTDEYKPKE